MAKIVRIILLIILIMMTATCLAETEQRWILCQPDSYVNIRSSAAKGSQVIGRYELGQVVETDCVRKNGFLHLINLALEDNDGWVSVGFVSEYPVQTVKIQAKIASKGRVACRRSAGGERRKWLKNDCLLWVFGRSAEWSVTNEGFVQTQYLVFEGE